MCKLNYTTTINANIMVYLFFHCQNKAQESTGFLLIAWKRSGEGLKEPLISGHSQRKNSRKQKRQRSPPGRPFYIRISSPAYIFIVRRRTTSQKERTKRETHVIENRDDFVNQFHDGILIGELNFVTQLTKISVRLLPKPINYFEI